MRSLVYALLIVSSIAVSVTFSGMCPYSGEGDVIVRGNEAVFSISRNGVLENLALEDTMFDSLKSVEFVVERKKFTPESVERSDGSVIVRGSAGDLPVEIRYEPIEKGLRVKVSFPKTERIDDLRVVLEPCDFDPLIIRGRNFHFVQGRHVAYAISFPGSVSMYTAGMFIVAKRGALVDGDEEKFEFEILVDKDVESLKRRLGLLGEREVKRRVVDSNGNPITGLPVVLTLDGRYVSAAIPDADGNVSFRVGEGEVGFEVLGEDVDLEDEGKKLVTSYPSKVDYRWSPYVTGVSENSAHVALRLTRPGTVLIVLDGRELSDGLVDTFHMVPIENLKPNTEYEVFVSTLAGKKEVSFRTFGAKEFKFAVYGDTRTNETWHEMVCDAIAKENVLFLIHTGDLVESGDLMTDWDAFFRAGRDLFSKVPLVPTLGNHERNSPIYYQAFYLPKGGGDFQKRWYSLDVGYLHITVLDSTVPRGSKVDEMQLSWLEEDLKNAKDKFKIVVFHYPFFTNSPNREPNHREDWQELFERYGVKLVLNGHMHHYERFLISGVTYVTTGGGGAPLGFGLKSPERKYIEGTKAGEAGYLHYVLAKVLNDRVEFSVKAVARYDWGVLEREEKVIDRFVIRR